MVDADSGLEPSVPDPDHSQVFSRGRKETLIGVSEPRVLMISLCLPPIPPDHLHKGVPPQRVSLCNGDRDHCGSAQAVAELCVRSERVKRAGREAKVGQEIGIIQGRRLSAAGGGNKVGGCKKPGNQDACCAPSAHDHTGGWLTASRPV